jgi:hypothetical protein
MEAEQQATYLDVVGSLGQRELDCSRPLPDSL